MSGKLFLGSILLIIIWGVFFVGFHMGGVVHMLLAVGVVGLIYRLVYKGAMSK
jgi:hypothetical protein